MRASILLWALSALASGVDAQFTSPADEVGPFARVIGHWEGSGQVWSEPGAEPQAWTARESLAWALDGFFVRSELEVRSEAFPLPMTSCSVYGWEPSGRRYVAFTTSNLGEAELDEAFWIDDTFLITRTTIERGQPLVERIALTFADDRYRMQVERGIGIGELHLHVEGEFVRVEAPQAPPTIAASAPIAPTPTAMTKVLGMVGDWKMAGTMVPLPGMPAMPVQATETIRSLWGGSCVTNEVVGEPSPMGQYRGLGFMTWNARDETYRHVWFDNMGSVQETRGQFVGTDLVLRYSGLEYGVPVVSRSTMAFDDAGRLAGFHVDRLATRGDLERSFEVAYVAAD